MVMGGQMWEEVLEIAEVIVPPRGRTSGPVVGVFARREELLHSVLARRQQQRSDVFILN